ncbi:MAG: nucleotidyl transferase AbiEii/AbiGii toxin family protein [Planctomycetes bacterium]|nr:nucleotidyl transferase AbiEii/AbiGii toxin family protein [Planctomycetota bacterium]
MLRKRLAVAVERRLRERAGQAGEDLHLFLVRFLGERLLYRLSRSGHAQSFVLKRAVLPGAWSNYTRRTGGDLELLGGGPPDVVRMERVFREIAGVAAPEDGVDFDPESVHAEPADSHSGTESLRVAVTGALDTSHSGIQLHVRFGDVVTPAAQETTLPTLLELLPAPKVLVCPRETVVAEKFQSVMEVGPTGDLLPDLLDLHLLAMGFAFDGELLGRAIRATFSRRFTPLPSTMPFALTEAFAAHPANALAWKALAADVHRETGRPGIQQGLSDVTRDLYAFLSPPAEALLREQTFAMVWPPGGPWHPPGAER